MGIGILMQMAGSIVFELPTWWRGLRIAHKLSVGGSVLVACSMVHLGFMAAERVRDSAVHRSAAAAALYMDSFLAANVQELATQSSLSDENRMTLERLLSPSAMRRPVVAFRVWSGDMIAFSNERALIGQRFPHDRARDRALRGGIGVEFEDIGGDDDKQVQSLKVPVLEVYAPVRERGTDRIIAVAETYEIAVDLKREVLFDQLVIWLAVGATTLTIVVLNFGMASTGSVERSSLVRRIRELSRLRGESDQRRERISAANLHMTEVGERSLGQVGAELFDGPAQLVALALLKLSSLNDVVSMAKSAMPTHSDESAEDLATIKAALTSTLRHINRIATRLLPPDIDELSTSATIVSAARRHEERTGLPLRYEACDLPDLLPYPFKASLFRFALEALDLSAGQRAQSQSMRGCRKDDNIVIEIMGGHSPPLGAGSPELAGLRDRVEALGGIFSVRSTPAGEVTFTAEFSYSEVARG